MADVNRGNRPLSPFMIGPYYRPQLTSMSSIMVRITGIAILAIAPVIAAWLLSASSSETVYDFINGILGSWFGNLVMIGATWALLYHMLGRLRHVLWDFGYCLDVPTSEKLAIGMFGGATLLTVFVWLVL
ncbi:MAG: succinate dehydrogenase, cytochrome b556 subunit [Pseudomonadota bacterium]